MAIECYYGSCRFHGTQETPDEGPFCHEADCRATPEELRHFEAQRAVERKRPDDTEGGTCD